MDIVWLVFCGGVGGVCCWEIVRCWFWLLVGVGGWWLCRFVVFC